MSEKLLYLDSSALVKLIVPERETHALTLRLASSPERASSRLAVVELTRALRRLRAPADVRRRAAEVLAHIGLIQVDDAILDLASEIDPPHLRSLDAVHLATALRIGPDLEALATYDARLAEAARSHGLAVIAPA
ncbi:MAG: type II toxin-antitoxin system VapC family toxin [Thermoanaerobaculia bacterium]